MKKFTFLFVFAIAASLIMGSNAFGQAISQRGSATNANTTTSTLTITKPTGLAVGDVMIANIVQGDNADNQTLGNASRTGWTVVRGAEFGDNGNTSWWGTVLYKVADASDVAAANFAFTLNGNSDAAVGGLMAFYNVNTTGGVGPTGAGTGPFDVAAGTLQGTGNANSSTVTAPGITTVTAGAAVIMFGMMGNNNSFTDNSWSTTSPASLNEILDQNSNSNPDEGVGAAFALKAVAGATGNGTATISSNRNGGLLVALKPAFPAPAPPAAANLWASSSDGSIVSSYSVALGYYYSGPTTLFTPTFPGTTTGATYTSAIGRTDKPSQALGHHYWIGNTGSNSGVVEIWGATSTGASPTRLGSIDMNGAGDGTSLGFVRLGMGPDGTGWILAGTSGGGATLYLAKFATNLLAAVTPVIEDAEVTLVGGAASTFQNGDLCISGNGNIYALANDGSGTTQIFIGAPAGSSTTLTKKWDLVDNNNAAFTGSVNGVAFSSTGSLYITTAAGLYYIDATTVNGPAGTVETSLVHAQTGLHDLSSNVFPTNSTLPVKLISFTGTLNGNTTSLNWVTENIQNFSHFEVERSTDGINFTSIVSKNATGDLSSRATYLYGDNMTSFGANYAVYYRLKMIDLDGKFTYSNIILIRKDGKAITDIRVIPNPLIRGSIATIRFEATERATVNLNVLDMSGRTVLRQQNNVEQGTNSVPLNNFTTLQPGTYILQMNDGVNIQTTKFIIAK